MKGPHTIRNAGQPRSTLRIVANRTSWMGRTNRWALRWLAQVLEDATGTPLWECAHGHYRKRDALDCGFAWASDRLKHMQEGRP